MNLIGLRTVALLSMALLFSPHAVAATETGGPAAAVQALYRISLDHFSGFTPDSVKLTQPWIAPELQARLWKKVNAPQPKDAAPEIEGDIFLDCQEPPSKFEVGKSSIRQDRARVTVTLIWPAEKRHYTVLLEKIKGAWKVYDVLYDKDGKLTDLL